MPCEAECEHKRPCRSLNMKYSSAINDAMDSLIPIGISSPSLSPFVSVKSRSLARPANFRAKINNLVVLSTVTTAFLLLTFTVTPSAAVAQRPSSSSNPHSKNLAACSSDSDCDSSRTFLRCHQRVCQCSAINNFDDEINRCLIRVGGSCTAGNQKQFCVAYASCETRGKASATGECKCRSKFRETIDNLCVSGVGSSYYNNYSFLLSLPLAVTVMQLLAGQR